MKRYISLIMVVVLLLTTFAGCKAVDKNKNVVNATFNEYLVAEKVGTVKRDNFSTADGGLYYKDDNGLYGVISYNGMRDTGAIYANVKPEGVYFHVNTKTVNGSADYAAMNSSQLIDGKGKVIVSGYACYEVLNERYIKVVKITGYAAGKDDCVATVTKLGNYFDGYSDVGDCTFYAGEWYIYDIVTGTYVPGAMGKNNTLVSACGRYVSFNDVNDNRISMDETGTALPKGGHLFEDGSYKIESKVGEVYDANGKLMFNYDLTGYVPSYYENGYYQASKYVDGVTKYVVMNNKGEVISTEFDSYFTIYGDVVKCEDKVYDLQGKLVIDGSYESVYFDKVFSQNWIIRNDDYYTLIDKNGAVFFNGPSDKEHNVDTSNFLASKNIDGDYYYYSHKDQDYTIKGSNFAPWIVKTSNSNSMYDLVDTMTGKKLLEGYSGYDSISRRSMAYYVYAKYNGGADVYLIVSGAQLADVTNKKRDLFAELSAEFEKEGIQVTVNKESGEIALDSSVLFGGDSAELTADGKAFLNKFIKAYAAVVGSEKYDGFIAKTMVEGHTAPIEGSTYAGSLPLSEQRAENVKAYCVSAETGVDVSKISSTLEAVGYSNSQPVYGADGSVDLDASRRVSFRFIVNVDF